MVLQVLLYVHSDHTDYWGRGNGPSSLSLFGPLSLIGTLSLSEGVSESLEVGPKVAVEDL